MALRGRRPISRINCSLQVILPMDLMDFLRVQAATRDTTLQEVVRTLIQKEKLLHTQKSSQR